MESIAEDSSSEDRDSSVTNVNVACNDSPPAEKSSNSAPSGASNTTLDRTVDSPSAARTSDSSRPDAKEVTRKDADGFDMPPPVSRFARAGRRRNPAPSKLMPPAAHFGPKDTRMKDDADVQVRPGSNAAGDPLLNPGAAARELSSVDACASPGANQIRFMELMSYNRGPMPGPGDASGRGISKEEARVPQMMHRSKNDFDDFRRLLCFLF